MIRLLSFLFASAILFGQSEADLRRGVSRALPLIQKSAATFVEKRACFSCHHNAWPILALRMAAQREIPIDQTVLRALEEKTFRPLRAPNSLDEAIQANAVTDPTPNESLLLSAAGWARVAPDLTLAVTARRILNWQRDGHWVTSDFRPPHSSSLFTATATAIQAIDAYLPSELKREKDSAFAASREWLIKTRPLSTEDATFRVLGLLWAKGDASPAVKDLLALQHSDGGWGQLPGYVSDAYSTGEALYALPRDPTSRAARQRAVKFLLSTQAKDGSWHVRSRMLSPAEVSPRYFETGFPYAKDEFISYIGSVWAVLGLLRGIAGEEPSWTGSEITSPPETPWLRSILFGQTREVVATLATGVSPNFQTANGTSLLMMVAQEPFKVQALLARGADAKMRSKSGVDALTVAASYRGTVESLRTLLDGGAEVNAPKEARHSALKFAAMTGDLDNVRLLLARGADPNLRSPISDAVTFGYPDVVAELVRGGASVGLRESTGINLLHWATITNRSTVIPELVKAGVPLNAEDDFLYTPLHYAGTIDFGETNSLRALLAAGANRNAKNEDGRTALEQARKLRHRAIAAELSR